MIQEYLNKQFIQITEDTNLEKLKKTCGDLANKIGKDKSKVLSFSLIAFDPEIPADNKHIIEIQDLIIENWPTFLSNSKDTKKTIIRAVILDALQSISKETVTACLVWFASRNVFMYYKLGREKEILTSFLKGLGNRIESEVSKSWNFPPDKEILVPKVPTASIDEKDLATLEPTTIKTAVDKALKKQIRELRESQKKFTDKVALMQIRTQLLWWKEAGYSSSQKSTYKDMKDGQLHVLLAYDYSNFMPEMYPVSADYFLLETLKSLSADAEKKTKISVFIKMIEQNSSDLKAILPYYIVGDKRISFANFIKGLVQRRYQAKQFKNLVGVAGTTELTFGELTLWIFHDLHSIKLSTKK